jgi:hypothetical protein
MGVVMEILVDVKNVYGQELVYPICPKAKLFAEMVGTKTLTKQVLAHIRKLGYTVVIKQKELQ